MSEQLTLELPVDTDWLPQRPSELPKKEPAWYQCFTKDTDELEAAQAFVRRYGYPPREVYRELGILWVGPIQDHQ